MADVRASLVRLSLLLWSVDAGVGDHVVFGSTVMYAHGLRETIGDVDVFVTRPAWGRLLAQGDAIVQTPKAGDPPLLEFDCSDIGGPPIHVFYDWADSGAWLSIDGCFASAETLPGIPDAPARLYFASLEWVREVKARSFAANPDSERHAKHGRDVELIDRHLVVVYRERAAARYTT